MVAFQLGDEVVYRAMQIARTMGLRIHEVVRLYHAQIRRAMRTGSLRVKGKGGKERDVPLTEEARTALEGVLKRSKRGHKVFVSPDEKAHNVIKNIKSWIIYHRT
jgi:site-specific recombinase XerD